MMVQKKPTFTTLAVLVGLEGGKGGSTGNSLV